MMLHIIALAGGIGGDLLLIWLSLRAARRWVIATIEERIEERAHIDQRLQRFKG